MERGNKRPDLLFSCPLNPWHDWWSSLPGITIRYLGISRQDFDGCDSKSLMPTIIFDWVSSCRVPCRTRWLAVYPSASGDRAETLATLHNSPLSLEDHLATVVVECFRWLRAASNCTTCTYNNSGTPQSMRISGPLVRLCLRYSTDWMS